MIIVDKPVMVLYADEVKNYVEPAKQESSAIFFGVFGQRIG
jgi:hypothetical protein